MRRKATPERSTGELKAQVDLDKAQSELIRLKKKMRGSEDGAEDVVDEVTGETGHPQRLAELFALQLDEHRQHTETLRALLRDLALLRNEASLDDLLARVTELIQEHVGFRTVLLRMREPGTERLVARGFAGIDAVARQRLESSEVTVGDFLSWLRDDFKISQSYFIGHANPFNKLLPEGYASSPQSDEDWKWHPDDVLLVPVFSADDQLAGYISVDDPHDRRVPSRELVELLEIVAGHVVAEIESVARIDQLEERLRELESAGQHLQEMHQLKSNFVSTVSHELRTPLTAIRAYVDTLLAARDGEIPHTQTQRFLHIIHDESDRLARLVESVLDLNKFDSGAIRPARDTVDLAEVLEETVRILEPVARVGQVSLKVARDCADTQIDANRDQIRQLAVHLGGNAVKFTPPGGAVTLRLMGDEREVMLQVDDTGIGIPERSLEKIFDRFYQVDSSLVRRYGGTGIGLAICKSIVDWHGGRIVAESTPGVGSSFSVTLPRRTAPRVLLRPTPKPQPQSEDILRLAMELVAEVMNARVVSLVTPDVSGDLVVRAAIGLDEAVVREARIKPGEGVAGWVVTNRRPVCVSGSEKRVEVEVSNRPRYRSHTFLSVPLEGEHGLLGVLNVTDPVTLKPFDAEDCHMLLHLADRFVSAWSQALDMELTHAGVEDTAHALRQVLRHLERGRQSAPDRVRLARETARELGLPESDVGVISFAASVHDVGMRHLGERVIDGGGALSDKDREAVERHPEMGAELLRPIETMGAVRDIVLSHHEWWDGTGYPRGLKGAQISIGGRVLAVVDAYESMTVGRAHRPAVTPPDALREIARLSGRQFDPAVVEAFERAIARPKGKAKGRGPGADKASEARR